MRRAIVQEDSLGCGAACVAFVTKNNYKTILEGLGKSQARTKGFMCKDLKVELSKYGFTYATKYVKSKMRDKIYQEGVIVFIKRSNRYPRGHFLTYHEGYWMDSWINWPSDSNLKNAKAGFRKRLPGQVQYVLLPVEFQL